MHGMELASLIVFGLAVAITVNAAWTASRRSRGIGCFSFLVASMLLAIGYFGFAWLGPEAGVGGAMGIALPLAGAAAGLGVAALAFRREGNPFAPIALSGLLGVTGWMAWQHQPDVLERRAIEIEARIDVLDRQREALEARRDVEVPSFRRALDRQAADIRGQMLSASPANTVLLESELRDIARLQIGLEGEEERINELIVRIEAQQRGLERTRHTASTLEDYATLEQTLDDLWMESGVLLDRSLSDRLREDAAGAAEVDEAFRRLIEDGPPDDDG